MVTPTEFLMDSRILYQVNVLFCKEHVIQPPSEVSSLHVSSPICEEAELSLTRVKVSECVNEAAVNHNLKRVPFFLCKASTSLHSIRVINVNIMMCNIEISCSDHWLFLILKLHKVVLQSNVPFFNPII